MFRGSIDEPWKVEKRCSSAKEAKVLNLATFLTSFRIDKRKTFSGHLIEFPMNLRKTTSSLNELSFTFTL